MTAKLFLVLVAALASGVALAAWLYLPRRSLVIVLVGLPIWLVYVGALSAWGVVADPGLRPPGALYIFAPVFLFIFLFAVRSQAAASMAAALPLWLLIGAQSFRVAVEIGIHRLGVEGLVPTLMTYEGGNLDIVIGLTAPLAAWLSTRGRLARRVVFGWNVLGLLALANIAGRAVLTAPGPLNLIQAEAPNVAIGMFPYTYLAGFFAPMGVFLHVLAMRALRSAEVAVDRPSRVSSTASGNPVSDDPLRTRA